MFKLKAIKVQPDEIENMVRQLQDDAKLLDLTAKAYAIAKVLGQREEWYPTHWYYHDSKGLGVNVYMANEDMSPNVEIRIFPQGLSSDVITGIEIVYYAEYNHADAGYYGFTNLQDKEAIVSPADRTELYRPGEGAFTWEMEIARLYSEVGKIRHHISEETPAKIAKQWGFIVQKRRAKKAA